MDLLTINPWWRTKPGNLSAAYLSFGNSTFTCRKLTGSYDLPVLISAKLRRRFGASIRAFAGQKVVKKLRRKGKTQKDVTSPPNKPLFNEDDGQADRPPSGDDYIHDNNQTSSLSNLDAQTAVAIPTRSAVLQACIVTSGLIGALGVLVRQVSHVASTEGWPIIDCSTTLSFGFELWHLELITGLVILISSCRYLLLKTWPDFAESSEAANSQIKKKNLCPVACNCKKSCLIVDLSYQIFV
ncbi:unnamed protein product [Ilex paraguariensis]|uniref:Uncharacterized protein n=1 Tax=Ilex paraguariensis TaxID=185542 RepID=A0ABC8TSE8_9AQUA